MNDWYTLENADRVDSPSLLFYPDRIRENLRILKSFVPDANRLRPHVKTNKCAQVCSMMMDEGIDRFKCATIAEAEMLAQLKASDVLLAYQPVGPKVDRLLQLIKKYPDTRFSCLVDNSISAQQMNDRAADLRQKISVFIDLNVGMNRTGISPELAFDLWKLIISLPNLLFKGLHAYDGHLRQADFQERKAACDAGFSHVERLSDRLQQAGASAFTIVAGGTPSFTIHALRPEVECSPGTFILWDKGYQQILSEQPFLFGALVVTRIISMPDLETITVDLGHKSIASENSLSQRVYFLNGADLTPIGHSEEHLVLRAPNGHSYRVGQLLFGVPHHICPTVALHETATIVTNKQAGDEWPILSRKRKLTI